MARAWAIAPWTLRKVAALLIAMNPQDLTWSRDYQERSMLTFHTDSKARGQTPMSTRFFVALTSLLKQAAG
jgi:hypothetical protein